MLKEPEPDKDSVLKSLNQLTSKEFEILISGCNFPNKVCDNSPEKVILYDLHDGETEGLNVPVPVCNEHFTETLNILKEEANAQNSTSNFRTMSAAQWVNS